MAKLPKKYQFLDLSDYGRSGGHWIASKLLTVIQALEKVVEANDSYTLQ